MITKMTMIINDSDHDKIKFRDIILHKKLSTTWFLKKYKRLKANAE